MPPARGRFHTSQRRCPDCKRPINQHKHVPGDRECARILFGDKLRASGMTDLVGRKLTAMRLYVVYPTNTGHRPQAWTWRTLVNMADDGASNEDLRAYFEILSPVQQNRPDPEEKEKTLSEDTDEKTS